jgi:hypothetical protein
MAVPLAEASRMPTHLLVTMWPTCVGVSWHAEAVRVVIDESLGGAGESLRGQREVLTTLGIEQIKGCGVTPAACNKHKCDVSIILRRCISNRSTT